MPTQVSLEALRAELQRLGVAPDDTGMSTREWATHWQVSLVQARKTITECLVQGLMTMRMGTRTRLMDQRLQQVPIYTLVAEAMSKKTPKRPATVKN